jgi:transcriptional regulator with XRE-family HTH domain
MASREESITDHVIRQLARLRARKGLTYQQVADRAGITRTYLSFLEKGRRRPTLDVALRLAGALETSLRRLLAKAEREVGDEE